MNVLYSRNQLLKVKALFVRPASQAIGGKDNTVSIDLAMFIGEATMSNLGKQNLLRVGVEYCAEQATANIYIALEDESREAQLHAFDRFADVQELLDEQDIELMIHLVSAEADLFESSHVKELVVSR